MECNKDEAVRAKQLAENRMQKGEFVEALKFAKKAKNLFPDIENIVHILAVCEVHSAAKNKLPGSGSDMDWYGILQTQRVADEAAIRKQYRKLALLLHPDKNKFAGAEAAFKLIGEANRVLSDQSKRSLYDMKLTVSVRKAAPKAKTSSHQSKENVFAAKHVGNARNRQKNSVPNTPFWNANQQTAQHTFWTSCKHCNSKFKYCITFVNATLLCENCLKPFIARAVSHEIGTPVVLRVPKVAPMHGPEKPASESKGEKPLGGGSNACASTSFMKTCATGFGEKYKGKKSNDGNAPASKTMGPRTSANVGSKRVRQSAPGSKGSFNSRNGDVMRDMNAGENDVDPSSVNVRRSSRQKQQVSYAENLEDDDFEIPSKKPRQDGSFNTNEVEKNNVPVSCAAGVVNQNREMRNNTSTPPEETLLNNTTSKFEHSHVQGEKVLESDLNVRKSKGVNSNAPSCPEVIHCPEPDFNDFENDKAEGCFAVNQLWAIYDTVDSMPRFYALVKKVASPFKLHITWLEPVPNDKVGIDLCDAELPIACGKFKLGDSQKTTNRDMFSHQVQCMKGNGKGTYLVYPKKGETWAIFRDWDIKWSSNPENYLNGEFEYVEILSDFAENVGIEVAYLGKLQGFVSLFQKTEKNGVNISRVLPYELYRFSHQIPSYRMTGDEREGVPRGCFELDPAALPSNFFEAGEYGDVKKGSSAKEYTEKV